MISLHRRSFVAVAIGTALSLSGLSCAEKAEKASTKKTIKQEIKRDIERKKADPDGFWNTPPEKVPVAPGDEVYNPDGKPADGKPSPGNGADKYPDQGQNPNKPGEPPIDPVNPVPPPSPPMPPVNPPVPVYPPVPVDPTDPVNPPAPPVNPPAPVDPVNPPTPIDPVNPPAPPVNPPSPPVNPPTPTPPGPLPHGNALLETRIKRQERIKALAALAQGKSQNFHKPEYLVDQMSVRTLDEIDAASLRAAVLDESRTPWAGYYWPFASGSIAERYADSAFPRFKPLTNNEANNQPIRDYNEKSVPYLIAQFFQTLFSGGGAVMEMTDLSPAEKYDLLVGDENKTLTRNVLSEMKSYLNYGRVEQWMGLCHGWAPASYMHSRPTRAISMPSADGSHQIPFYPADIKALSTLLWANIDVPFNHASGQRFIGRRCQYRDGMPPNAAGAVEAAQKCFFDLDPSTWHLSIVNQIGVSQRPFIMDATFDRQVWNQPVYGYHTYFYDPRSGDYKSRWQDAQVALQDLPQDDFSQYRSPEARSIVGVRMDVFYVKEIAPVAQAHETAEYEAYQDSRVRVEYYYDLELDASGKIVGGAWSMNYYPDFLWNMSPRVRAWTDADHQLDQSGGDLWNGNGPIPREWLNPVRNASSQRMPLARIVEALHSKAAQ